MVDIRNVYTILVGKPKGKIPITRHRHRCGIDNIKMNLREIGLEGVIGFIWLRIGSGGGLFEHGNEPLGSSEGRKFLD
jgi:hypothetical protein